ncbi:MAG: alpha/beta hydrolase [Hyphomicrobiales bacterium]|nr:alpha/beta hydrolase [Hyphomicrobiales bacterium]MCP5371277.1 alpha/beta hydrolase [Hyphomicrobiales bacterium]
MDGHETTQFLDVDGTRLEVQWVGRTDADAPVLVFLHEGLGCVEMWKGFPAKVADRTGLPALVFSRRGYGRSDPCDLPRPVDFMHHEGLHVMPRLLDAAGIGRAVLVGHSDGGSIALVHAGGARDPRVRAVVTIAAHVFNEEVCVASIRAAREAYATTDLRARLARYHGDNVDCAFRGWNDVWLHPDFWHWNLEEFLPGITVPALVIQGSADEYGTERQVDTIVHGVAGPVVKCMVAGAGHSPHLVKPDATLDAIARFVAELKL